MLSSKFTRVLLSLATLAATFAATLAASTVQAAPFFPYCTVIGALYNPDGSLAAAPTDWIMWRYDNAVSRGDVCKQVTANLLQVYGQTPIRMESGVYDANNTIQVLIDCFDGYRETMAGHGAAGMQAAFDRVGQLGKACLLRVF